MASWTVGHLKKILARMDDDFIVVMSGDEEGNAFHLLNEVSTCKYMPGEKDILVQGDSDWNKDSDRANAVCFWPE